MIPIIQIKSKSRPDLHDLENLGKRWKVKDKTRKGFIPDGYQCPRQMSTASPFTASTSASSQSTGLAAQTVELWTIPSSDSEDVDYGTASGSDVEV